MGFATSHTFVGYSGAKRACRRRLGEGCIRRIPRLRPDGSILRPSTLCLCLLLQIRVDLGLGVTEAGWIGGGAFAAFVAIAIYP